MPDQQGQPPFPFIVGSGRCGTTLLRAMFDSHPQMAVPREVYFPIKPLKGWFDANGVLMPERAVQNLEHQSWFHKLALPAGAFDEAVAREQPATYPDVVRCLYAVYAASQGKTRYGNKSPMHVASIAQIAAMLPEAKFIHLIRDGRNVALSYLERKFGPTDLAWAAHAWRSRVMRGTRAGAQLGPQRYREVRYEDFLEDPEAELRALCSFVDLPFDPAMLLYYERVPDMVVGRGSVRELSLPPTKGLRDWRRQMSPVHVALFESIAGPTLERFGYELAAEDISSRDRVRVGWMKLTSDVRRRIRKGRLALATGRTHG